MLKVTLRLFLNLPSIVHIIFYDSKVCWLDITTQPFLRLKFYNKMIVQIAQFQSEILNRHCVNEEVVLFVCLAFFFKFIIMLLFIIYNL